MCYFRHSQTAFYLIINVLKFWHELSYICIMKAINPKNQKLIDKCLKFNAAYDAASNLRDTLEGAGEKTKKINATCEKLFYKFLDACNDLPKYELRNLENKIKY